MNVAVVHYHLRPGGVTTVVNHCIRALRPYQVNLAVLAGERSVYPLVDDTTVRKIPGLGYQNSVEQNVSPDKLAADMCDAAKSAFGGAMPDVWHIHNHGLGKNAALPGAVRQLAEEGCSLLLHIHDFAEDGRPANYRHLVKNAAHGDHATLHRLLYPTADHIRYAVLNSRDHEFLRYAGVPEPHVGLLQNPVDIGTQTEIEKSAKSMEADRLFLYPVRAIRRKNLGEFLLLSALAPPGDRFAVTLSPRNPAAQPVYEDWVAFARASRLPVDFELGKGNGTDLASLMARAYATVTTSVAEGFGMAFLEPWLCDRTVYGRKLPDVTQQFADAGIALPETYTELCIPPEWLDTSSLKQEITESWKKMMQAYGRDADRRCTEAVLNSMLGSDCLDFGRLSERHQQRAIRRIIDSETARMRLRAYRVGTKPINKAVLRANKTIVERDFNLDKYGRNLYAIYRSLMNQRVSRVECASGEDLLDQFLAPQRFSLLRTC